MGLGSVISSALEAVRSETESLRVTVTHEAWLSQNALGVPSYDVPVPRSALVQEGRKQVQTLDGRVLTVKATLTFFPATEDEAPMEYLPEGETAAPPVFGLRDRITLPSGLTGTLVEAPSTLINPASGAPYLRTLWLV